MFGLFSPSRPQYVGIAQTASPPGNAGLLGLFSKLLGGQQAPSYVTVVSTAPQNAATKELPPAEVVETVNPLNANQLVIVANQPMTITIVMNPIPTPSQETNDPSDL